MAHAPDDEDLKKMSFGDHLEEARRRMLICMAVLVVAVGVLLPFKREVTEIFMGPYRTMWKQAYQEFVTGIEADFANEPGPADPKARLAAAEFLSEETVKAVLRGDFPDPEKLRSVGGSDLTYPTKSTPEWDRFAADFERYATGVRGRLDGINRVIWHRRNKASILAGTYPYPGLIDSGGGFMLKYNLVATNPLEDFWTFMAACLLFACMAAAPVLLWHMWAFVAAGLYKKERAVVYRTMPFAMALLVAGVAFGYTTMVPYGFLFLTKMIDSVDIGPMFTVAAYFKFFLTLTFALGIVFQLPIVMLALQKVGILKFDTMRKQWRVVILSFFVISAVLTPPDPVTQMLMVTPMMLLFLLGLVLMWRAERRKPPGGGQA